MVSSVLQPGFDSGVATLTAGAPSGDTSRPRRSRRPSRRDLRCPVHPNTALTGTGRKYFLHLLTPEELKQRGLSEKRAKLVIQAYPGAGAQQRVAGGALVPRVRPETLVPRHPPRPHPPHGALGAAASQQANRRGPPL